MWHRVYDLKWGALIAGVILILTGTGAVAARASSATAVPQPFDQRHAAALTASPGLGVSASRLITSTPGLGSQLPPKGHPKLESILWRLAEAYDRAGMSAASQLAQRQGLELDRGGVEVVVESRPLSVSRVSRGVRAAGGRVLSRYGDLVLAAVPVEALIDLAESPAVRRVRTPLRPHPAVTSEGVNLIGADDWHATGFNGNEIKVAVIDLGFEGYTTLLGSELPGSIIQWPIGGPITGTTSHGTACAEIVYDVAPSVQMYLVKIGNEVDLGNAVDWLIGQDVDVISHSVNWFNAGPGDGTGVIADIVDRARSAGILWVNAVGNMARRYYQATFRDNSGNDWHEFSVSPLDEYNTFYASSGETIYAYLSWDAWPITDQDFDLYLYRSGVSSPVEWSANYQNGSQPPTEALSYQVGEAGSYHLAIRKDNATTNPTLRLFAPNHDLEYRTSAGSVAAPADADSALAVGATHWSDDSLESFSSQGPTTDGRTKPDVVAPDGVSTQTYGPSNGQPYPGGTGFFGTSASTPHVAGAAALVKDRYPSYTADQIQNYLESRAVDKGSAGMDNLYGWGRLDIGDRTPPSSTASAPAYDNGGPIPVSWSASDDFTGVASTTLWLKQGDSGTWADSGLLTQTGSNGVFDFAPSGDEVYYFATRAVDRAGNYEAEPTGAGDTSTIYDTTPPASAVNALPIHSRAPSFSVGWSGSDNLAGIASYDVYQRTDGGGWALWQNDTTATAVTFSGQAGHTYYFYSQAMDKAGNAEAAPGGDGDAHTTLVNYFVSGRVLGNRDEGVFHAAITATPPIPGPDVVEANIYYQFGVTLTAAYEITVTQPDFGLLPPMKNVTVAGDVEDLDFWLPPPDNVVANWGFESGSFGSGDWAARGPITPVVTTTAHTGDYAALFPGGYQPGRGLLTQTVYLSPTISQPTLSFVYRVGGGGVVSNTFRVLISDAVHTLPLTADSWTHVWYDLSAYTGTVPIGFELVQDTPYLVYLPVVLKTYGGGTGNSLAGALGGGLANPVTVYVDEVSLGSAAEAPRKIFLPVLLKGSS